MRDKDVGDQSEGDQGVRDKGVRDKGVGDQVGSGLGGRVGPQVTII